MDRVGPWDRQIETREAAAAQVRDDSRTAPMICLTKSRRPATRMARPPSSLSNWTLVTMAETNPATRAVASAGVTARNLAEVAV